jgi:hypothetical protein
LTLAAPTLNHGFSRDGYFGEVEFAVANKARRRTAREVEVLLTAYATEDTDHYPPTFRDQPLHWSNHGSFTVDVPPGVERRCVGLFLGDPRLIYEEAGFAPSALDEVEDEDILDTYLSAVGAFPGPTRVPGDIRWMEPGIVYELWLVVTAADVSATIYRGEIQAMDRGTHVTAQWVQPLELRESVDPTGIVLKG